jgi:hypothetical protein
VDQAHYLGHSVDLTGIGTWLVEHDPTICIIEVRATVQVSVDVNVEFFIYDTIDHEELNFGSLEVSRDHELAGGEYDVDVGEVNPDFDQEP